MPTKPTTLTRWIEEATEVYADLTDRLNGERVRVSCGRCGGSGFFNCWGHINQGRCFLCGGSGTRTRALRAVAAEGRKIRDSRDPVKVAAKAAKARAKAHAKQVAVTSQARAFLAGEPSLAVALRADHHITRDLARKLARNGSLSEAQVKLAAKLVVEAAVAQVKAATEIEVPEGRRTVEAKIISFKTTESQYGVAYKMLVEIEEDGGVYRAFGTEPSSLDAERGDVVKLTATFQPKERGFGFFSRPRVA